MDYEVIPSQHWHNVLTGQNASLYGAVPWTNDNEKLAWTIKERGWTVRNPYTNQIGIGRKPFATFADAVQWASNHKPSRMSIGD